MQGGEQSIWVCWADPQYFFQSLVTSAQSFVGCFVYNPFRIRAVLGCTSASGGITLQALLNPFNWNGVDTFIEPILSWAESVTDFDQLPSVWAAAVDYYETGDQDCEGNVAFRLVLEGENDDGTPLRQNGILQHNICYTWKFYNCMDDNGSDNSWASSDCAEATWNSNTWSRQGQTGRSLRCSCSSQARLNCRRWSTSTCTGYITSHGARLLGDGTTGGEERAYSINTCLSYAGNYWDGPYMGPRWDFDLDGGYNDDMGRTFNIMKNFGAQPC